MTTFFNRLFQKDEQIDKKDLSCQASLSLAYSIIDKKLLLNCLRSKEQIADDWVEFFENCIQRDAKQLCSLQEEYESLKMYCMLAERYVVDGVNVTVDFAMAENKFVIPPFLLFPLVQNAIQHGYHDQKRFPVRIKGKLLGEVLVLEVSNQVNHYVEDQRETELMTLYKARLDFEYKDQYTLILNSNSKTFKATLQLNLAH